MFPVNKSIPTSLYTNYCIDLLLVPVGSELVQLSNSDRPPNPSDPGPLNYDNYVFLLRLNQAAKLCLVTIVLC